MKAEGKIHNTFSSYGLIVKRYISGALDANHTEIDAQKAIQFGPWRFAQ